MTIGIWSNSLGFQKFSLHVAISLYSMKNSKTPVYSRIDLDTEILLIKKTEVPAFGLKWGKLELIHLILELLCFSWCHR